MKKERIIFIGIAMIILLVGIGGGMVFNDRGRHTQSKITQISEHQPVHRVSKPPTVSDGREWKVNLVQPGIKSGWVNTPITLKARSTVDVANQVVQRLMQPQKNTFDFHFPKGVKVNTRIWDETLQIHFSDEIKSMPPLANEVEEAEVIGMFVKSLVGLSKEFNDIQFYVDDQPVTHLFGSHIDTSQPFAQMPYVNHTAGN